MISISVYYKDRLVVPKCVFKTDNEVIEEVRALLRDLSNDEHIKIEQVEMAEEQFELLEEFE